MLTIRKILDRKRLRLKDHDYSKDGLYYVTICVQDHIKCLGCIKNDKMELNDFGKIVNRQFEWMQNQYPYIKITEYIVMPDHIHAIIEINRKLMQSKFPDNPQQIKIKPLPELIGAYKTTTSKKIHQSGFSGFRWQRSYHERIIRNKIQYTRISEYIRNNPVMSGRDRTDQSPKNVMSGRDRTESDVMSGRDRTQPHDSLSGRDRTQQQTPNP